MTGARKSVRLFGENLDEGMHICTFFRTAAEKYHVLMPFIREGMEQGDRAFHIVNPSLRSAHAQRIAEAGIDAARAEGEHLRERPAARVHSAVLGDRDRRREARRKRRKHDLEGLQATPRRPDDYEVVTRHDQYIFR